MDENKTTGKNNGAENNRPAPPPIAPKAPAVKDSGAASPKGKEKVNKKLLYILIPVIAILIIGAVVGAIALKNGKDKNNDGTTLAESKVVVVTDENGVAVTDENGVPVTYVAVTEVVYVTDANGVPVTDEKGKNVTTVVYKQENVTVNVPVTNSKGEAVTNGKGEVVTQQVTLPQNPNNQGNGNIILGTTIIPVTDGQGNTAVDESGNLFTTIVELTSNPVTVEPADIDFKASMGGTAEDYFSSIDADKDGNYIAANVTNSKDGDFKEFAELNYMAPYTVLVKYDKSGNVKWRKPIGSPRGTLQIMDVLCNEDGTFYAVGYGKNVGGKNGRGYYDCVVYKFDKDGNELWYKIFGTSTVDMFNSATLTADGGIVAVGTVGNNDFDAEEFGKNELESAACIVKYDKSGNLLWKNVLGGNKDYFSDVAESKDGSIFVVGTFYSGTLFANVGSSDAGIVKFNAQGKYVDVAPIAGKGIESFTGIAACKAGGVVVVGKSNSSDSGNTTSTFVSDLASRGGYDAYIMKYEEDLTRAFAKPFRGQYDDDLVDVIEKEDGTFIATGKSNSSSRDLKGITTRGGDDMVIASFDKYGNLSWARSFGGTLNESASAICLAKDNGYVIAGRTLSKDIDMKGIAQYVNGRSVGVIAKFPE